MIERSLLLLVAALTVSVLSQETEMRDILQPASENEDQSRFDTFPVDVLGLAVDENVAVMFGLRLFDGVHDALQLCRENRRKIEVKFANRHKSMQRYFHDTEMAIKRPQFEKLMHENKDDIELNFQNAFKQLRRSRVKELDKHYERCNATLDSFVARHLYEAMRYAESLIVQYPDDYARLTMDASLFGIRLRAALAQCISDQPHSNRRQHQSRHSNENKGVNPDAHGDLHFDLCYVHEMEILVDFIDHFLAKMDELTRHYYTDDEDLYYDDLIAGSGDLEDKEEPEKPLRNTPPPPPPPDDQETPRKFPISGFFEPGPVILGNGNGNPDDGGKGRKTGPPPSEMTESSPSDAQDRPTTPIEPSAISKMDPLAPLSTHDVASPTTESKSEDYGDSDYDGDDEKDGEESTASPIATEERPTTDRDSNPTHEYPPWVDDAFNEVLNGHKKEDGENEDRGDINEKELKTAARSRSREEEEEEEPQHHGSIDLNLPGVNVEIDSNGIDIETNIGPEGNGHPLSIVFEDDQAQTTAASSGDEDDSFITYMLIYFFSTLGSLLVLAIIVLSIAIIILRMRNRSSNYTPLLSEDEKIAVMKQTGYVNPTYKFFDHAKDV